MEIRKFHKTAPIILVATKIDVREKEQLQMSNLNNKCKRTTVSQKEGLLLAKRINANMFIECSALSKVIKKSIDFVFY